MTLISVYPFFLVKGSTLQASDILRQVHRPGVGPFVLETACERVGYDQVSE
jgi:hypothetical protein